MQLIDSPTLDPRLAAASRSSAPITPVDYLARDYESFRTLLLDQMAARLPNWTERNPSDLGVAILEVLAYAADYLSYFQDAVATEAYLQTARLRTSVRRHGRLVDYFLDEGCNARVWVHVAVRGGERVALARGTQLLTRAGDMPAVVPYGSGEYDQALAAGSQVFETMVPALLDPGLEELRFHTGGAQQFQLPAGATSAVLAGHVAGLRQGDVLLLEQVKSPTTGRAQDADPHRRHIVRLTAALAAARDAGGGAPVTRVEWAADDALPFALPVAVRRGDQALGDLAVARGNLVLADCGRTIVELLPAVPEAAVTAGGAAAPYLPVLERTDLTFRAVPDPDLLAKLPAAAALEQPSDEVLAAVSLVELDAHCSPKGDVVTSRGAVWLPARDLLVSDRFARDFVVEMDERRQAHLRFGDGRAGRRPPPGSRFEAYYRVGSGARGNVTHDAIAHLVSDDDRLIGARNPLPAVGGAPWEPLERARLLIPTAFHTQRRCVTADDFTAAARLHPDVLDAAARLRWTGSWTTAFVYLQRRGGLAAADAAALPVPAAEPAALLAPALDPRFEATMTALLQPLLVAGMELALREPLWVALDVALRITVYPRHDHGVVQNRLEDVLGDGPAGFFHPDKLTFAAPVYLSDLIARASEVDGVVEVVAETFQRRDHPGDAALKRGYVALSALEIAMLRNDPAKPQDGTLSLVLETGR